jgi:hypothetical protein
VEGGSVKPHLIEESGDDVRKGLATGLELNYLCVPSECLRGLSACLPQSCESSGLAAQRSKWALDSSRQSWQSAWQSTSHHQMDCLVLAGLGL